MAKKKNVEEVSSVANSKDRLAALLQSDLITKLNKTMGGAGIQRASDEKLQSWHRLPSGILPLDYALNGGFPRGVVNTLWGDKSSSKTSTIIRTIAQAQKICRECVKPFPVEHLLEEWCCQCKGDPVQRMHTSAFIDVEGTLDLEWCRLLGVDTDRMLLARPDHAELTFDILEGLLRQGTDSPDIDIVAVDSLAFLTPQKEIENATAKDLMGTQSRAIAKGVRKLTSALNAAGMNYGHDRRPTIFFTNQIRMQIGVMFGNPETQAGGKSPGYSAVTEVKMFPGKYKMDEVTGFPLSAEIRFRVDKNKSSFNKVEGEYTLVLSQTDSKNVGSIYDEPWLFDRGEILRLISRDGGTWSCLGEHFPKKEAVIDRFLTDPTFKNRVWQAILPTASPSYGIPLGALP